MKPSITFWYHVCMPMNSGSNFCTKVGLQFLAPQLGEDSFDDWWGKRSLVVWMVQFRRAPTLWLFLVSWLCGVTVIGMYLMEYLWALLELSYLLVMSFIYVAGCGSLRFDRGQVLFVGRRSSLGSLWCMCFARFGVFLGLCARSLFLMQCRRASLSPAGWLFFFICDSYVCSGKKIMFCNYSL